MDQFMSDGMFAWCLACVLVGGWTIGGLVARALAWCLRSKE